jgi:hypothetical protein
MNEIIMTQAHLLIYYDIIMLVMINTKTNSHCADIKSKAFTKNKFLLIVPIGMFLLLAIGLASVNVIYAQTNSTQTSNKQGTIKSVQNGPDGKAAWNLAGNWNSTGLNSKTPTFNSHFSMAKLDGSSKHTHTISNFKMAGNPVTNTTGTAYKGTVTVTMKEGPVNNVPITVVLSPTGDLSITLDAKLTSNHFGNTPIKGKTA